MQIDLIDLTVVVAAVGMFVAVTVVVVDMILAVTVVVVGMIVAAAAVVVDTRADVVVEARIVAVVG